MTSLQPRGPYTQAELDKLYPKSLQLELVQVLLRHGERSPVSARFQNVSHIPRDIYHQAHPMAGWSRPLLAVLQCCSATAFRGYDSERHLSVELFTVAETVGKVWGG